MTAPAVILLNGATSSGKSSLAQELQARLPGPYLHIGIDGFLSTLPERLHDSADGVRFEHRADGAVPVRLGAAGRALERAYHLAVRATVDQGLRVIVDDVLFEPWLLDDWLDVLEGIDVLFVGVFCPLVELERREFARGDRVVGQARAQVDVVHSHGCYDVTVDTSELALEACADRIIAACANADGLGAFGTLRTRHSTEAGLDTRAALVRMRAAWSADTSSLWTPELPARGQCDATALVVHAVHGGELLKTPVPGAGMPHFYNRVGGQRVDLTAEQFENPIVYADELASAEEVEATLKPGQFETLFAHYLDGDDPQDTAPVLATERLRFVPFRGADLPLLCTFHEDPRVQSGYTADAAPWPRWKTAAKLAGWVGEHRLRGHSKWKLCLPDGTFIGRAGWAVWGPDAELEIGYALKSEFRARGLALEAARALVGWAWANTTADHVVGFAYVENTASRRVLERIGMAHVDDRVIEDGPCAFYRLDRPGGAAGR